MRIYYAFSMKEETKKLYEDHPLNLYLILRNLYFMREADQEYAIYLYKQMINKLNKSKSTATYSFNITIHTRILKMEKNTLSIIYIKMK